MTDPALDDAGQWMFIAAWGVLVLLLLPRLILEYRGRVTTAMSHLAVWGLLFMALISAYAYRDDLRAVAARVSGELSPYGSTTAVNTPEGDRAVRIRRSARGSFFARASINGAAVPMLVDTGASMVVLTAADAERAGFDLSRLRFTVEVDTANGRTTSAPVRIAEISVGGIVFQDVEALVAQPGNLRESLLGMSFLRLLRSYEVVGEFLTLRG
jgi:aspartyl protease family protein